MSNLLRVQNISAGYGDREIIHNVSFALQSGTLTGLLGPNGCGKTTLIRTIINQLPHSGSCLLNGCMLEPLSQRKLARLVSYIAQRSSLSVSLPVLDVVLMGFNARLKLLQSPGISHKQRALEALAEVGLEEFAYDDYQTLSEGQKQLVLIARTMIEDTKLLVLDEPDSALDFQNRYQVLSLLHKLVVSEEKVGLLCLHDPGLALTFCKQILLMKDGEILHILHPEEDSAVCMEAALRDLYSNVSLAEHFDCRGRRHLSVFWEERA